MYRYAYICYSLCWKRNWKIMIMISYIDRRRIVEKVKKHIYYIARAWRWAAACCKQLWIGWVSFSYSCVFSFGPSSEALLTIIIVVNVCGGLKVVFLREDAFFVAKNYFSLRNRGFGRNDPAGSPSGARVCERRGLRASNWRASEAGVKFSWFLHPMPPRMAILDRALPTPGKLIDSEKNWPPLSVINLEFSYC